MSQWRQEFFKIAFTITYSWSWRNACQWGIFSDGTVVGWHRWHSWWHRSLKLATKILYQSVDSERVKSKLLNYHFQSVNKCVGDYLSARGGFPIVNIIRAMPEFDTAWIGHTRLADLFHQAVNLTLLRLEGCQPLWSYPRYPYLWRQVKNDLSQLNGWTVRLRFLTFRLLNLPLCNCRYPRTLVS